MELSQKDAPEVCGKWNYLTFTPLQDSSYEAGASSAFVEVAPLMRRKALSGRPPKEHE